MTYNVFSGTLNPAQSINHSQEFFSSGSKMYHTISSSRCKHETTAVGEILFPQNFVIRFMKTSQGIPFMAGGMGPDFRNFPI